MPLSPDGVQRSARISIDQKHRYWLGRSYEGNTPSAPCSVWCMLNPSTADADIDDATIRTIRLFSEDWGKPAFAVVNLFSYRATDPKALRDACANDEQIVGPQWDGYVANALSLCTFYNEPLTCAWGAFEPAALRDARRFQISRVANMARERNVPLQCIGTSRDGHPFHPLYHTPRKHFRQELEIS